MKDLERKGSYQRKQQVVDLRNKEVWLDDRGSGGVVGGEIREGARIKQKPDHRPLRMRQPFIFLYGQRKIL